MFAARREEAIAASEPQPGRFRLVDDRTDEQLLADYRSGDERAFRTLIDRHRRDLLQFLIRFTGNRQAAEDVFQETFLQIHQSADTFDTSRRFKPWLFTIAANKARDFHRKSARRPVMGFSAPMGEEGDRPYVDLMEVDVPAPSSPLDARERDQMVQRVVDSLPEMHREILLLAYFQRMSYAQIAETLGVPLGTVKSRLHAAVAMFARRWKAAAQRGEAEEDHSDEDASRR